MPIEKIKALLEDRELSESEVRWRINEMDAHEIARRFHQLGGEEKVRVFQYLDSDKKRQEFLYETDHDSRLELQESLDSDYLARLLDEMPEDEATDILKEHPVETQEKLLSKMGPQDAGVIKDLISYGEETAGSLMAPKFNRATADQTAAEILRNYQRAPEHEHSPYFYVVNPKNELIGFFKLRDLLNVPQKAKASTFLQKDPPKVLLDDHCEKVANLMDNEQMSTIPVVDENNVIHGIITFDDVIRMTKDIASEDIFTMVGTATVDPFAKRTLRKVTARAPWLFTTFLGGLLSAFVLSSFEQTLREIAAIIFFIPFVIGLAGNVALQGATVIVRGMATGDIQSDNLRTVVKSELMVGMLNGMIFGLLCGACVTAIAIPILNSSPILGLTVGTGIILAVCVSSLIGSLTPILFMRLNIDPAISTGPFITVTNDIVGLAIYLATATIIFAIK